METHCERCTKEVEEYLYALENHGRIYKWVCEKCYFAWLHERQNKQQARILADSSTL